MLTYKVLFGVFLCTIFINGCLADPALKRRTTSLARDMADIGQRTQCLGGANSDEKTIQQIYRIYDHLLTDIKSQFGVSLTKEKIISKLHTAVVKTQERLTALDANCLCRPKNDPFISIRLEIIDLGRLLQKNGLMISCLLNDNLDQIPAILHTQLQIIALTPEPYKTSVGILVSKLGKIGWNLRKLNQDCGEVSLSC